MPISRWRVDGPAFLSEQQGDNGVLGCDYTEGIDTRWPGKMMLGPLLTTLDLTPAGGTAANTNGMAIAPVTMQAAGPFIYLIRGTKWAKVKITSAANVLTLSSDDTETALGEAATSIIYTKNAAGTEEITIGMDNTAARVITAVGAGATDTDNAVTGAYKWRILGVAGSVSSAGEIAAFGRGAGTAMNLAQQITLSGTVSMATPTVTTRSTISGETVVFTGFAMDEDFWLVGTSNGPYYLDSSFNSFRPLIPELDQDNAHCGQMASWSMLGPAVLIPLKRSLRMSRALNSRSVGPEVYRENASPISGTMTAFCASELWGYMAFWNPVLDKTYICAVRPRQGDDWHGNPLSYYPIAKLADGIEARSAYFVGTQATRTLPLVAFGYDDDMVTFDEGRENRFYEDTAYPFAASGTWYGTTLTAAPHIKKRVKWVEFEAEDCTENSETITVSIVGLNTYGVEETVQVAGSVEANGIQRLYVPDGSPIVFRNPKPKVVMARGATTTNSPKIARGELSIMWEPVE